MWADIRFGNNSGVLLFQMVEFSLDMYDTTSLYQRQVYLGDDSDSNCRQENLK